MLWILCQLITSVVATIGVPPEKAHLYEPILKDGQKTWKCLGDPSIVLRYDQINDDYCDCPDGSDEIGTNACKFNESNMFYCANEGYFPSYLENFKLNDGACDYDKCCDGSDEYLSGGCPNKCQQINNQFLDYKQQMNEKIQAAKHTTQRLTTQAKNIEDKLKSQKDTLILDIAKTENVISAIEKKLGLIKNPKLATAYNVFDSLKTMTTNVYSRLPELSEQLSSSTKKITYLESLMDALKQDQANTQQVLEDYEFYLKTKGDSSNSGDSVLNEIEELLKTTKSVATTSVNLDGGVIVPTVSNMVHYYVKSLFQLFSGEKEEISPELQDAANVQALDALELKLSTIKKELKSKTTNLDSIKKDLNVNYGPNGILRSVKGNWVNKKIGEYEYKVGLLGSIYQDTNLLGRYSHYKDGKLYYDRGEKCWNGPLRSTILVLSCGTSNELISVSEPEKCEYVIQMNSPLGCRDISEQELRSSFKIAYDKL